MKNISILLVDDEIDSLILLESLLKKINFVKVLGKADNRSEAIAKIVELKPDVVFQDIEMHDINGLELVDEYRKYHFAGKVVFVTAHAEYAIDAIKKTAYDYLLKPVDMEELNSLVFRMLSDLNETGDQQADQVRRLKIPTRQGYSLVNVNDIIYCEADGNYTCITSGEDDKVTTSTNLGKIEEELNDSKFFRISRSVVINTDYLTSLDKGKKICHLKKQKDEYDFHISSKRIKILEHLT
jgi:DNA-binding LytR/AlgR family response regulator